MSESTDRTELVRSALRQYEGPLLRYARRWTGDADAARDLVQETFLRLCRIDAEAVRGHLAAWLFTVCRNRALEMRRKDQRVRTIDDLRGSEPASRAATPLAVAEARQGASRIAAALEQLTEAQQEVVRLKFQGGLSYREISEVTGRSVTSVGVALHGAIRRIRELLDEAGSPRRAANGRMS